MRRKWIWISLLVVTGLGLLVWQAPARLIERQLEKSAHPLQLRMTEGSIWNGRAQQAAWQGLQLGRVEWQTDRLDLLPPALHLSLQAEGPQLNANGELTVDRFGNLSGGPLGGSMPARWIDIQALAPLVFLDGQIDWSLDRLHWPRDGQVRASGVFHWRNAALTGLAKATMGDLRFVLEEQPSQLSARIESLRPGDISITGLIETDARQYRLDMMLDISPARPDIRRLLAPYGKRQPDGRIRIQWQGWLFPDSQAQENS